MSMNRDNFRANQPPSKVLHVRNLPPDVSDEEVLQLCRPFGRIVRIKLSGKEKTQAFVEFDNINQAIQMVAYFVGNSNPPKVRNKAVYLQYSTRSEIGGGGSGGGLAITGGAGAAAAPAPATPSASAANGTVLLVIMDNINVALGPTLESLHLMFSTFGSVAKITLFGEKADGLQALVQMADAGVAREARQQLDGRVMPPYLVPSHPGDIRLKVSFSEHTSINVRYQTPRTRDFTNAYLPHAPTGDVASLSGASAAAGGEVAPSSVLLLMVDNVVYPVTVDALHTICSTYGHVLKMTVFEKGGNWQALVQFADVASASNAKLCLEGHCMYEGNANKLKASHSVHNDINVRNNTEFTRDFTQAGPAPTTPAPTVAELTAQAAPVLGSAAAACHADSGGTDGRAELVASVSGVISRPVQYLRGIDWEAAHEDAAKQANAAMSAALTSSAHRPAPRPMFAHGGGHGPPLPAMGPWGSMPMQPAYGGMPPTGFSYGYAGSYR